MRSSAGCGAERASASHCSIVTRWPLTSVPRISSSTGSTEAGTLGSCSPKAVSTSTIVSAPIASPNSASVGVAGGSSAATASSTAGSPISGSAVACGGATYRTSSPAASRSAMSWMPSRSALMAPLSCSAACSCGRVWCTWATSAITAGLAGRVPSSTRLSMFSTFQLNSPKVLAPTRRPLPLRVWKMRRIGRRHSPSSGAWRHNGSNSPRLLVSSSSSSRKTSRISSSMSRLCSKRPRATFAGSFAPTVDSIGATTSTAATSASAAATSDSTDSGNSNGTAISPGDVATACSSGSGQ